MIAALQMFNVICVNAKSRCECVRTNRVHAKPNSDGSNAVVEGIQGLKFAVWLLSSDFIFKERTEHF